MHVSWVCSSSLVGFPLVNLSFVSLVCRAPVKNINEYKEKDVPSLWRPHLVGMMPGRLPSVILPPRCPGAFQLEILTVFTYSEF